MFETARECTLTIRNFACSMIMISKNTTPMTLLQGNGSSAQLQEARVQGFLIPKLNNDLQHQHNQCECQSIAKGDIVKLVLNILTQCLAVNIHMEDKSIPNFKIHKKFLFREQKQVNS